MAIALAATNRQGETPIPLESHLMSIGYGLARGQPLAVSQGETHVMALTDPFFLPPLSCRILFKPNRGTYA